MEIADVRTTAVAAIALCAESSFVFFFSFLVGIKPDVGCRQQHVFFVIVQRIGKLSVTTATSKIVVLAR